jgi:nucleotide-binding universal stress UspA family protein
MTGAQAGTGSATRGRRTARARQGVFGCIVVATDGSGTAAVAVRYAVDLARCCRARLHVVNARRSGGEMVATTLETAGLCGVAAEAAVAAQGRLRAEFDALGAELREEGLDVTVHCVPGEPADVIVRVAEQENADLVIVGNRGMHRRVLGSVPNSVSHRAPCSVLIVRTT